MPKNLNTKNKNTEIELKYLLSRSGWTSLCSTLKHKKISESHQKNSYFDNSTKTLRRKKIALRIRTTPRGSHLTVKFPSTTKTSTKGLSYRKEYECSISPAHVKLLSRPKRDSVLNRYLPWRILCEKIPLEKLSTLKPFVSFSTLRQSYRLSSGLVAELDSVQLENGESFFELEVECIQVRKARRLCEALLKAHNLKARPIQRTKLARALKNKRK